MQFKNLRDIREDKDIKQKDIAKYLNVSQNTYCASVPFGNLSYVA